MIRSQAVNWVSDPSEDPFLMEDIDELVEKQMKEWVCDASSICRYLNCFHYEWFQTAENLSTLVHSSLFVCTSSSYLLFLNDSGVVMK